MDKAIIIEKGNPKTRAIWAQCGMEVAERILGLGDRKHGSPTCGCYDRMFWKYKLIDFPSAWFQSAVEYLSLLFHNDASRFSGNDKILVWAKNARDFALSSLNGDGSLAEAYPWERSYCVTAFVTAHLGVVPGHENEDDKAKLLKMAEFLDKPSKIKASNQIAAAALALFRVGRLLNERDMITKGRNKLSLLYDMRTAEECFSEYGGTDLGYLSITLSLLARIENEFPGEVDRTQLEKSISCLEAVVCDDGNYDCFLTSRGTQFLYPFGLAFWCSSVLGRLEKGLMENAVIRPGWLDDRYVIELAIDYLYLANWLEKDSNPS